MATFASHDNLTASPVVRTIEGNVKWNGSLTFNFVDTRAEALVYSGQGVAQAGLPAGWIAQVSTALRMYDDVIALDMSVTGSASADYLIGTEPSPEFLGSANGPLPVGPGEYLIVAFNTIAEANAAPAERGGGSERLQTIVHEIGHTLGLNHPHGDDDGSTIAPGSGAFGFKMAQPYLGHQTVQSYAPAPNTFVDAGRFPVLLGFDFGRSVAPMAIDIAALHRLYGANMETRTGNTTYTLSDPRTADLDLISTDGTISVGRAYYGIWDAGRADTDILRYDGVQDVLINLMAATPNGGAAAKAAATGAARLVELGVLDRLDAGTRLEIADASVHPGGFFSSILTDEGARVPGGYSIAQGVRIEVAQGGAGDDLLIGNEGRNVLIGNGGSDVMVGGAGDDIARFAGAKGGYVLGRDGEGVTVSRGSATDALYDVEALVFRDSFVLTDVTTTLSDAEVRTVGYLFEAGLDRNGALNASGLKNWIAARQSGLSEEDMATRFLDSAEFTNHNGAQATLSDRALIDVLYRNVLDRRGEKAGVDGWADRLDDASFSRGDLLLGFAGSRENMAGSPALSVFDDAIM